MAAAVASLPAHAGRSTTYTRSPTTLLPPSPSRAATRVRINPACVARPDSDDAKRQRRRDEEYSPPTRRHARRVPRHDGKEEEGERYDCAPPPLQRGVARIEAPRTTIEASFSRTRHGSHRNDKTHERDRDEKDRGRRRSHSRSSRSDQSKARPDPCPAATAPQQQQMPMPIEVAPAVKPAAGSLDGGSWVMQDLTESFEEVEWRRREEARREMDKVVQTVFFNDSRISPQDLSERYIVDLCL
ncbi:hypothetical protein BRADI_1g23555v3 [Brachypodium distachyon]|uniref:Uncharacterized protein n=1 Tax=Brachypodium distachyon TaxID=15368 RepID=A0A0Q3JC79_BRADI|nr:hypothetical protein BRADI_1g23555v3 [Brachypodium distachyon]